MNQLMITIIGIGEYSDVRHFSVKTILSPFREYDFERTSPHAGFNVKFSAHDRCLSTNRALFFVY